MGAKAVISWTEKNLREVKSPEDLPSEFNFAAALLDRHLAEGRGSQIALRGPAGNLTYEHLYRLANQAGNAFRSLGLDEEQRVLLLLRDSPEFIASFLGAMKIGAIPCPLNTFAHPSDYEYYFRHSRARMVVGEAEFLKPLEPILPNFPKCRVVSVRGEGVLGAHRFEQMVAAQSSELDPARTHKDQPSHWVYSSGSTGEPKAVVHLHKNTIFAIEPYIRHVLRMTPEDISFSVARLFFSYGMSNSMFMPLWVGASSVLLPDRPEPERALALIEEYGPTLFYSVPTAYGRMLRENLDLKKLRSLRLCISAGEALPAPIYLEWKEKTGLEIIDGVGSTEFGYIFLTNRSGDVRPGSSGKMLPEHKARLVDAEGAEVAGGQMGELLVSSPAIAAYYHQNSAASKRTFAGEWLRTGDQYARDEQGCYIYQGRSDDLFKSGGIWVSPIQIESTLLSHPAVAEASVVAERDPQGLEKPVAYIVLRKGFDANAEIQEDLRKFTREQLAVYKCPKSFHFVSELPKTATGKIQRYKLRMQVGSENIREAEKS